MGVKKASACTWGGPIKFSDKLLFNVVAKLQKREKNILWQIGKNIIIVIEQHANNVGDSILPIRLGKRGKNQLI